MNPSYQLHTPPFVARPPPLVREKTYSKTMPSIQVDGLARRLDTIFDMEPVGIPPLINPDDIIEPNEKKRIISECTPCLPRVNSNTTSSVDMPALQKNTNNTDQKEK